uniref:IRF tryptophan pentad repeat domain-containing protein n=2 Tax=Callorhinchus milii TaxID=7868 RepID=A0A4W3K5T0_CALMI
MGTASLDTTSHNVGLQFGSRAMGRTRMNHPKPQIRTWLIEQIDSAKYNGLRWLDHPDCTKFRISWKHASRQDLQEDDYSIFKGWAIISGKYTEGDMTDPPKWKTNFRCALNSISSFQLLDDKSKESSDPHKVFLIKDHNPNLSKKPQLNESVEEEDDLELRMSPETDFSYFTQLAFPHPQEHLDEMLTTMTLSDNPGENQWEASHPVYLPNLCPYKPLMMEQFNNSLNIPYHEELRISPAQVVPNGLLWESMQPSVLPELAHYAQEVPVAYETPQLPLNVPPLVAANGPAAELQHCHSIRNSLGVTVYYRGKAVLQRTVKTGFRLLQNVQDTTCGHLEQIAFPSTESISDQKQKEFTDCLLSNVEGGLTLELRGQHIYAKRTGKCQVFWSLTEVNESQESQKLMREKETRLFSLSDFLMEIKEFTEHRRGTPRCSIYLCLGQYFPVRNPAKMLVLIKVVPKICSTLIELAQQGGASSLNSDNVNLQISNNSNDNFWAIVRELESSMEVDSACEPSTVITHSTQPYPNEFNYSEF